MATTVVPWSLKQWRRKQSLTTHCTLLVSLVLLGCSSLSYPDVNTDPAKNNKATFQTDAIDCAKAYPESGSGAYVRERITCMNLKGWH